MKELEISVIVPCFNEAENVEPLALELVEVLRPLGHSFEILYVDDGSRDNTATAVEDLAGKFPELRLIRHTRNFGQSAAFLSGFEQAAGQILITLDADLQNDPRDIPKLLKGLEQADMVCGIRKNRRDSFIRKMSTRVANAVRGFFLKDGIKDAGCAFRVFRRELAGNLIAFKGLHRFLPTISRIHGYRVMQVPIHHRPRYRGTSKYGISNRLFVGIHDMLAIHWYRKRHFPPKRY